MAENDCIIIAGLGNPGGKYQNTRHNIGFDVVDAIADSFSVKIDQGKWSAYHRKVRNNDKSIIFVKPDTYMNLSGRALVKYLQYYKCSIHNLLVIHDDIDMRFGRLKLVAKGGAGGHNGIKSITQELSGNEFYRLKFGVGRPGQNDVDSRIPIEKYVLARFNPEERITIGEKMTAILQGIDIWLSGDSSAAMNFLNSIKG